jgi:hypothetical protein
MMKRLSFYVMRSLIASTASFHHQMIITTESTKLAEPCKPWGLAMSDIEQTPFTFNEFTENPEPRCACLLLDTSGSMGGAPIRELNEGLKAFRQELSQDSLAMKRVEDANCVVGDVNHGSILVAQDATVALIDCDSFEVNGNFAERRSSFRKIEICNRGLCKLSTMLSTATVRRRRHQADPTVNLAFS